MILVDYSNVATAAIIVAQKLGDNQDVLGPSFLLGKLRNYNVDFREKFGEMIICADHRSWRKDVFEYYKASRKVREPDDDFNELMCIRGDTYDALEKHSMFRCVKAFGAEGDDVMYRLSKEPGQHVIISADKDMTQLCSNRVKVWHPLKKEFVDNGKGFLRTLIATGDDGDGIPNFLSDGDTFVDPNKRQKPLRANIREAIQEAIDPIFEIPDLKVKGITSAEMIENWKRNELLIDLSKTPKKVQDDIMKAFESQEGKKFNLIDMITTLKAGHYMNKLQDFVPNKIKMDLT